jgi:hypothetical protein
MIGLAGSTGKALAAGIRAGFVTAGKPHLAIKQDFWVVARALLEYDLALLPKNSCRAVMLHSYLVDFALAFRRDDFLKSFFRACKSRFAAGVSTQQPASAVSALSRLNLSPNVFSYLYSPGDSATAELMKQIASSQVFRHCEIVPDSSNLPAVQQRKIVAPPVDNSFIVSSEFH